MSIVVTGYPSTTSQSFVTSDSYDSSELIKYLTIDASDFAGDEYLEVEYNSETITIYLVTECRYTPQEIHFLNKEGAQQTFTLFKASEEKIRVKRENYESDRGQPSAGNHQFIDYNSNSRTSFTANTGFIDEDLNDVIKQILLSSRIWKYDGSNYIPLNIKSTSKTYKTRQKDRLINYELEFEYSYNDINTI